MNLKFGLIAVSSLALILTACPSPNVSISGPPKYSKIGFVDLLGSSGFPRIFMASFYKLSTPIVQPTTVLRFPEDSCVIDKTTFGKSVKPGEDDRNTASLDAGVELIVQKSSATLSTLTASSQFQTIRAKEYLGSLTPQADTSGSTLDIPGATGGFPKMTATLPTEPVAYTFGPQTEVTKDTVFEWTSPRLGAVLIFVVASGTSPNTVYAECFAKDDGSFTFSANMKAALDAKGFTTGSLLSTNKLTFKFIPQDDALLVFQSARAATFVP